MEDKVTDDLEPISDIAKRAFPEEAAEVLQRKRVWVNSKWLTSDSKKSSKWIAPPKQERVLWGTCMCGESIYKGDAVGMHGDHVRVICYGCWMSGLFVEFHLDCCGLIFPDATLSH